MTKATQKTDIYGNKFTSYYRCIKPKKWCKEKWVNDCQEPRYAMSCPNCRAYPVLPYKTTKINLKAKRRME